MKTLRVDIPGVVCRNESYPLKVNRSEVDRSMCVCVVDIYNIFKTLL